jgi:hypothetical protein
MLGEPATLAKPNDTEGPTIENVRKHIWRSALARQGTPQSGFGNAVAYMAVIGDRLHAFHMRSTTSTAIPPLRFAKFLTLRQVTFKLATAGATCAKAIWGGRNPRRQYAPFPNARSRREMVLRRPSACTRREPFGQGSLMISRIASGPPRVLMALRSKTTDSDDRWLPRRDARAQPRGNGPNRRRACAHRACGVTNCPDIAVLMAGCDER